MHAYTHVCTHAYTQEEADEDTVWEAEKIVLTAIEKKPDDALFKKEYAKVMELQDNIQGAEVMLRKVCMFVFLYIFVCICMYEILAWCLIEVNPEEALKL